MNDQTLPIGADELAEAAETLRRYASAKSALTARLADDERWWTLRRCADGGPGSGLGSASGCASGSGASGFGSGASGSGDAAARGFGPGVAAAPSSAWLFNTILNKHADLMDSYPEPVVLPRERSDEQSARTLSAVLPALLESCGFEQTYSDLGWEKLKHGTAVWGVFWNAEKENGLGDVDIRAVDLARVFWEPGVSDIQKSKNLFLLDLADTEALEKAYPQYAGRLGGRFTDLRPFTAAEQASLMGEKSVVVDWYYKRRSGGRTVLHYAKFCGDCLLYASENDPDCAGRGFYDHGLYPFVFDTLFPEKGTPAGFGYIAVCKDPQTYIDRLSAGILENCLMTAKKRYLVSTSTNVSPEQFADWDRRIVPVEGELSDARIREISVDPVPAVCVEMLREKIAELKDTAGNRDVNSGKAGSGVTAAAAIVALQEAGNKTSRDLISASYRAHCAVMALAIELMRQFYGAGRSFRVTAPNGMAAYAEIGAAALGEQPAGLGADGRTLYRKPVFDLKIRAQKRNPFSRMELNERAKELYALGFFDPRRAREALGALEMMDFEGVEAVRERIRAGAEGGSL